MLLIFLNHLHHSPPVSLDPIHDMAYFSGGLAVWQFYAGGKFLDGQLSARNDFNQLLCKLSLSLSFNATDGNILGEHTK